MISTPNDVSPFDTDAVPWSDPVPQAPAPSPPAPRRRLLPATRPTLDRLPPNSPEAEQGVLGCILISPQTCMSESLMLLQSRPEAFYDLRHQEIYKAMMAMFGKNMNIDTITLMQFLKDDGKLEKIGGAVYLSTLSDGVPSAANLSYYAGIVYEKFLLRGLIQLCTETVGRLYDYEGDIAGFMDTFESRVLGLRSGMAGSACFSLKDIVGPVVRQIEAQFESGVIAGIASGFADLDKLTGGFIPGDMIVLAARTSVGKTAFAMNIAAHVAVELKIPVGVFSLEMTKESLVRRMLCSHARVNLRSVRDGFLVERDFPKLITAAGRLSGAPLWIDDTGGLSIMELRARARVMSQQHGIKLLIVDYLQLAHGHSRRSQENRQQEIAEISSGIKSLAKDLNIPVIVLSQLNRDIERDKKRKPRLSDLRESGATEQDADVVAMLYRANDDDEDANRDAVPIRMLVAKNRSGPAGEFDLTFLRSFTRFESASKISGEDVPESSYQSPHAND